MHWKVYKNPVAMAVGGVAAVLLEFADARIRSGVWDHSIYKQDPIGRSKRTGVAAMVGVYGPKRAAERVIQGVTNMHSRVSGTTPKGEAVSRARRRTARLGQRDSGVWISHGLRHVRRTRPRSRQVALLRRGGAGREALWRAAFADVDGGVLRHDEPAGRIASSRIRSTRSSSRSSMSGQAAPDTPKYLSRAMGRASVSLLPPIVREQARAGIEV